MKRQPMRKRATADAKKGNVPKVGLFFVVNGKPCVEGTPWTEIPSVAGFRTYAVGHPEYWVQLQQLGLAPRDMPYEDAPRGRVNYLDATGRFTLLADKCILKSNRLVGRIITVLGLPKNTTVLRDLHYKCAVCTGKVPTREQEAKDWDI